MFSPIVMSILPDKYLPEEIATPYGFKKSIISGMDGGRLWKQTNEKINNCDSTSDRVCWEMSNQQIFFTKDKKCIADSIRQFVSDNDKYDKSNEDGLSPLKRDHIIERFNEIANDIEALDEEEYPFFVFKNTSCDDGVERWFSKYNEDIKDNERYATYTCCESEELSKKTDTQGPVRYSVPPPAKKHGRDDRGASLAHPQAGGGATAAARCKNMAATP